MTWKKRSKKPVKSMNNTRPVYVGIERPSSVGENIRSYNKLMKISDEILDELKKTREEYDIAKVNFLDQMMEFIQDFKSFKKFIPNIRISEPKKQEIKKRLRKKVVEKKKELEQKPAPVKQIIPEKKRLEELDRIKNFRKELEKINTQLQELH